MRIHNRLPLLIECLERWKKRPTQRQFEEEYALPMREVAGGFFDDFYDVLLGLNWDLYRNEAILLKPEAEEARLKHWIQKCEDLFGFPLEGEALLLGAFTAMDGYARFDRGTHRVFLGVDESHGRGQYLDVLITHELTHVARESRPSVWEGWGLNPKMTQSEFTELQPVVEHLIGEGFSCVVSELLVPNEPAWNYCYQTKDSLASVLQHGPQLDRMIHKELKKPHGDYGTFYSFRPRYGHYAWAWQWTKHVMKEFCANDPRKLVTACSKEFVDDALRFELTRI